MVWRVAKSLLHLRAQVDAAHPDRDKENDGTIGDAAHAARTSDHNPWVKDGKVGVVTAMDITHDPRNGVDTYAFADFLRTHRDMRVKYIISNHRIANPDVKGGDWRRYNGSNPHDHHVHISVKPTKALYDYEADWPLGPLAVTQVTPTPTPGPAPVTLPGTAHPEINEDITASVFGGESDPNKSAYTNKLLLGNYYVALPFFFKGPRPQVVVMNKVNGKSAIASIEDVGPWMTDDPYWETGARPLAEDRTKPLPRGPNKGRRSNGAGIDLSPDLAEFLGIDGMGKVDWSFH